MKRSMPFLIICMIATTFATPFSVAAQSTAATATTAAADDPPVDKALCLPGVYPVDPADCLAMGPAKTLTDYAKVGLTFPATPIAMTRTPEDLAAVPYYYAKVTTLPAPYYNTLPTSKGETPSGKVDGHLIYISYDAAVNNDAGRFYQSADGTWFDGGNVARAVPTAFAGVVLQQTPSVVFGWVLTTTESYTAPSFSAPKTGKYYQRYDMLYFYGDVTAEGMEWCQIGPGEWVTKNTVARVISDTTPPQGVTGDRWIEVNLYEQTLLVYDKWQLVFATLASTGQPPFYTRPGLFQIYEKKDKETMTGSFEADRSDYYRLEDVPWTMYFDEARALHGAYWNNLYGYPLSHGCVNLSDGDAHWLYNWANVGDWVYVHDPSGQTPTDPSFYGPGGA
ncbi:MAG TPA: L,D-transpeptidase [Longilinea sp.]|nr:L,D-transpeptidase [Longilinea sp.]